MAIHIWYRKSYGAQMTHKPNQPNESHAFSILNEALSHHFGMNWRETYKGSNEYESKNPKTNTWVIVGKIYHNY